MCPRDRLPRIAGERRAELVSAMGRQWFNYDAVASRVGYVPEQPRGNKKPADERPEEPAPSQVPSF